MSANNNKDKLHRLENRWNDRYNSKNNESILSKKVFSNIKPYNPTLYEDHNQGSTKQTTNSAAYSSITEALGFRHHVGTDRQTELQIMKCILKRESLVMKLMSLCDSSSSSSSNSNTNKLSYDQNSFGAKLLDTMAQTRDIALNYIELLCSWRMSAKDFNPQFPKAFNWEGNNYTLKMVSDLDFMGECSFLLESLEIPHPRLISNPLMLSNSLFENSDNLVSPSPIDRAVRDARGETDGALFRDRMRLREAERVILQEIEFDLVRDGSNSIKTEISSVKNVKSQSTEFVHYPPSIATGTNSFNVMDDPKATWLNDAQAQIKLLESLKGEPLANTSTLRLDSLFQRKKNWTAEPTKLGSIDSTLLYHNQSHLHSHSRPNTSISPKLSSGGSRVGSRLSSAEGGKRGNSGNNVLLPSLGSNNNKGVGNGAQNVLVLDNNNSSSEFEPEPESESNELAALASALRIGVDDDSTEPGVDTRVGGGGALLPLKEIAYVDSSSEENSATVIVYSSRNNNNNNTTFLLTRNDISMLSSIRTPSKPVTLAGAVATIIVHDDPKEVPEDISWKAFLELCKDENLHLKLKKIIPDNIPQFKIRAVQPFMKDLKEFTRKDPSTNSESSSLDISAFKLAKWVCQIIKIATAPKVTSENSLTSKNQSVVSGSVGVKKPLPKKTIDKKVSTQASSKSSRTTSPSSSAPVPAALAPARSKHAAHESSSVVSSSAVSQNQSKKTSNKLLAPLSTSEYIPIHTEILQHVHVNPILLTFMQPQSGSSPPASAKAQRRYDPLDLVISSRQSGIDRYFIKLYDIIASVETTIPINIREYTILLYELKDKYTSHALKYFKPGESKWWIENLKFLIKVYRNPLKGTISAGISKQAIEKIVAKGTGVYEEMCNTTDTFTKQEAGFEHYFQESDHELTENERKFEIALELASNSLESPGNENSPAHEEIPEIPKSRKSSARVRVSSPSPSSARISTPKLNSNVELVAVHKKDGTYEVSYDKGESEKKIVRNFVETLAAAPPSNNKNVECNHLFHVGQLIEANLHSEGKWYAGSVTEVCANGTYVVTYDFGEIEEGVREELIVPLVISSKFKVNDLVEVNYKGLNEYYPARVADFNSDGTYKIEFSDGDFEPNVIEAFIRFANSNKPGPIAEPVAVLPTAKATTVFEPSVFTLEDHIEANYNKSGYYYKGSIIKYHGNKTYDVSYDNGETESMVAEEDIRLLLLLDSSSSSVDGSQLQQEQEQELATDSKQAADVQGDGRDDQHDSNSYQADEDFEEISVSKQEQEPERVVVEAPASVAIPDMDVTADGEGDEVDYGGDDEFEDLPVVDNVPKPQPSAVKDVPKEEKEEEEAEYGEGDFEDDKEVHGGAGAAGNVEALSVVSGSVDATTNGGNASVTEVLKKYVLGSGLDDDERTVTTVNGEANGNANGSSSGNNNKLDSSTGTTEAEDENFESFMQTALQRKPTVPSVTVNPVPVPSSPSRKAPRDEDDDYADDFAYGDDNFEDA